MGLFDSDPQSPPPQPNSLFIKGQQVEVSSDEEGFRGAWYLATILDSPPKSASKKKRKTLVEYKTLLAEDGHSPLTELVDPAYIRPLPPPPNDSGNGVFKENDVVDAECRDGWWTGVVRKILGGSKYRVYFDNPPDISDFHAKDLRLHWDWVDGKWILPDTPQMAGSDFSSGTAVEVNLEENVRNAWFPAVVIKENGDKTFLVKCWSPKNSNEGGELKFIVDSLRIRPTPPRYVARNYKLLDKVETPYDFGWRAGVITKLLAGRRYIVSFKAENEDKELDHSEIRPHIDWFGGKWISRSQEAMIVSDDHEKLANVQHGDENPELMLQPDSSDAAADHIAGATASKKISDLVEQTTNCEDKLSSHTMPLTSKKLKLTARNGNCLHRSPSKRLTERDASRAPLSVIPLQSKKMSAEMSTRLSLSAFSKRLVLDPMETESLSTGPMANNKRQKVIDLDSLTIKRRGRPIKSPIQVTMDLAAVDVAGAAEDIKKSEGKTRGIDNPVILGLEAAGMRGSHPNNPHEDADGGILMFKSYQEKNLNDLLGEKNVEPNLRGGGSQRRKRGRPRKVVIPGSNAAEAGKEDHFSEDIANKVAVKDDTRNESTLKGELVQCKVVQNTYTQSTNEVSETDCTTKDADKSISGIRKELADDDQPLSTWFGGIHSSTTVEDSRLSPGKALNGLNEARERRIVPVESCTIDVEDSGTLTGNQITPFLKRSPVWKSIEAMEVFQILPQNPHFYPLSECKEEYREGSAIGVMVTFASLFDKICTLRFEDSRSIFESTLETLADLEKHGFDVVSPRDRVNELLSIKNVQGELLHESKSAEIQIRGHSDERSRLHGVADDIEKKIAELQQELDATKTKIVAKDLEISELQAHADALNGRINSGRHEFEKILTAPWKLS